MFQKVETKVLIFNWKLKNIKIFNTLIEVSEELLAINESFQSTCHLISCFIAFCLNF